MPAKFITLEGLDGAGKSTHLAWIEGFLESRDIPVRVTREPGGTPVGEALRSLLLDRDQALHPETEALLMFAARREHIDKVIAPSLASGTWVLCDRFTDASYAYQAGGSGVAWEKIASLEAQMQESLHPDLTVYFDVTPEVGRSRVSAIKTPDRFEQEREAFHARARAAYLRRAAEHPRRMRVVDASQSIADVQGELEVLISKLCQAESSGGA